jgi:hypothetical protein
MMKPKDRFDNVRERTVADVVNECGDAYCSLETLGNIVGVSQLRDHPRRQMIRTQAMRKSRMLRTLICKIRQSQLSYPAQPLKLGGINERDDKSPLVRVGVDPDYVMYRIPVYLFCHALPGYCETRALRVAS